MNPSDAKDFDAEGEVHRELSGSRQTVKESLTDCVTYEKRLHPVLNRDVVCGIATMTSRAGICWKIRKASGDSSSLPL